MHKPEIALDEVRPGMFLLLGDDPLLDPSKATFLFYEPKEVLAVHRGAAPDDRSFLRERGMILQAADWEKNKHRRIVLEMARNDGGRVRVCFPDHRHVVSNVRVHDPVEFEVERQAWREANPARLVTNPKTGQIHDARDLSVYGLPPFWRDASVVWATLQASWIGTVGRMSELLVLEAIAGVERPARTQAGQARTLFHREVTIRTATLCWIDATITAPANGGIPDPMLGSALDALTHSFGSAERVATAALSQVDMLIAGSTADQSYVDRFRKERDALVADVAASRQV